MISISAAMLVKNSMKQMVFIELKGKRKISDNMITGDNHAESITKNMHQELGGSLKTNNFTIHFSVDGIVYNTAIEVKHVRDIDEVDSWFLNNSIIQSSFYAELLKHTNKLRTSYFRIVQGYKSVERSLIEWPIYYFVLMFGNDKYLISGSKKVFAHFVIKANEYSNIMKSIVVTDRLSVTNAFERAVKWDNIYKMKEDYLLKSINVIKLK
jgi:hypothetical protein